MWKSSYYVYLCHEINYRIELSILNPKSYFKVKCGIYEALLQKADSYYNLHIGYMNIIYLNSRLTT